MNIKALNITLLMSAFLIKPTMAATPTMTFKNLKGSVLEISILADNKITGFFTTAVASKSCPQAINTKRPITGYLVGNALTFSVVYPMCESLLSVTGNFDNNKKMIDTLSILNKQAKDIIHDGPGARFIGHDTYNKV